MNFRTAWSVEPRLPEVDRPAPEFSGFDAAIEAMKKMAVKECSEAGMVSPNKPKKTTGKDVLSDKRERINEKLRDIGEAKRRARCNKIMRILGKKGAMSCEDLAREISMSKSTTRKSLNQMIDDGLITRRIRDHGVVQWIYSSKDAAK